MRSVDAVTEGRSARANTAVLVSCAEVAGRLAAAHAAETGRASTERTGTTNRIPSTAATSPPPHT